MKKPTKRLMIEQLDKKLGPMKTMAVLTQPTGGWIRAIRTSLNMSLRQSASRMGISAPSVKDLEQREALGTISLNALRSAAQALNMNLVYGLVPRKGSLDEMITEKAKEVARNIVMRTDTTMRLEDQQVQKERLEKAVNELADEIKREMPKYLWD